MADVTLGADSATGAAVCLDAEDRARGIYVIGTTGMGKTVLLENIIAQDISAGNGLCVLDPHRDLIDHVLARLPATRLGDVIVLDVRDGAHPFGLNVFACENPADPEQVAQAADHAVQVFKKVWGVGDDRSWGPRLEDLLGNVAYTLIAHPGLTMAEIPRLLTDDAFRAALIANLDNPTVVDFWTHEYDPLGDREQRELRASTLNKVRAFLRDPLLLNIVGQTRTTIPFREILDQGKILLVKLDRRLEALTTLVGSMLVGQLITTAFARPEGARRPFALYADEYQRFATPDFAVLLTEARKYGITTTIAHQFRHQLDRENRGATLNASTTVVFRVIPEDASELAGVFDATPPRPEVRSERPIRVPTPTPIAHVLRHGHAQEHVRSLVAQKLLPLARLIEPDRLASLSLAGEGFVTSPWPLGALGQAFQDGGLYDTPRESVHHGLDLLDAYFVAMMQGTITNAQQEIAHFLEILVFLQSAIGFNTCLTVSEFLRPEPSVYSRRMDEATREALRRLVHAVITEQWATGAETAEQLAQEVDEITPMLWAAQYYANRALLRWERVPALSEEEKHEVLLQRAQAEERKLFEFFLVMLQLGRSLKETPILVDSGQYEPNAESPRTFADVQAEIANQLATLPRFTARCKVGACEYTLRPGWAGPAQLEAESMARINAANQLAGICRERELVAAEIMARRGGDLAEERAELSPTDQPDPAFVPTHGREPV